MSKFLALTLMIVMSSCVPNLAPASNVPSQTQPYDTPDGLKLKKIYF